MLNLQNENPASFFSFSPTLFVSACDTGIRDDTFFLDELFSVIAFTS